MVCWPSHRAASGPADTRPRLLLRCTRLDPKKRRSYVGDDDDPDDDDDDDPSGRRKYPGAVVVHCYTPKTVSSKAASLAAQGLWFLRDDWENRTTTTTGAAAAASGPSAAAASFGDRLAPLLLRPHLRDDAPPDQLGR
mmetsp:Transcript_10298/g.41672  ORF Transcript_10298/g.41672 Transcript_10298/m.41672 type:complete len:138 (-) Transcript_10298:116-529(-)